MSRIYSLFPVNDAFDPLELLETGAGESGGAAVDVGGVSVDDEGGGEDDIVVAHPAASRLSFPLYVLTTNNTK